MTVTSGQPDAQSGSITWTIRVATPASQPPAREVAATVAPLEEAENKKNLEHLVTLVDPDNDQGRLKCASILLALGRFGDARAIVALIEEERMFPFRDRFIGAVDQSQSKVFRIR